MEGDERMKRAVVQIPPTGKKTVAGQEMMNTKLNYLQTTCNKYSSLTSNKAGM
jgi:hypothetical protein